MAFEEGVKGVGGREGRVAFEEGSKGVMGEGGRLGARGVGGIEGSELSPLGVVVALAGRFTTEGVGEEGVSGLEGRVEGREGVVEGRVGTVVLAAVVMVVVPSEVTMVGGKAAP